LIKNSQPFGKKIQKTVGFFLTHIVNRWVKEYANKLNSSKFGMKKRSIVHGDSECMRSDRSVLCVAQSVLFQRTHHVDGDYQKA